MISTRVGYSGGTKKNPSYYELGDHTETVQIEFDPKTISYQELLELFWRGHDATLARSRQYRSLILFHNEEQRRLAQESKERQQGLLGRRLATEIVAFSQFFPAEDYHQKYMLRQMPELMSELRSVFGSDEDMVVSTAAARLNGLMGGYGSIEGLQKSLQGHYSGTWKVLGRIVGAPSR